MYFSHLPNPQIRQITRLLQMHQLVRRAVQQKCRHSTNRLGSANHFSSFHERKSLQNTTELYTPQSKYAAATNFGVNSFPYADQEAEIDAETHNANFKLLLYGEAEHELMQSLNQCENVQELSRKITQHNNLLKRQHHVQCIILIWLQRFNCSTVELSKVLEQVMSNLRPHIPALDINELSCCYLYLRKLAVPNGHSVLQELLLQSLHIIEKSPKTIELPALSRLIVGINTERDFHTPTVCRNFMTHIAKHVNDCITEHEARLLAVCFLNLYQLIDDEMMSAFKLRVRLLLAASAINAETPKTILKLLHMLNLPVWSLHNTQLTRELLLTIQPSVPLLSENELKPICRIFDFHQEPACLAAPLKNAIENLLASNPTTEMLSCLMPFVEPRNREPLIALFQRLLNNDESWQKPNANAHFFAILRSLKIADVKLCDAYWERVMTQLDHCPEERTLGRLLRQCHRYMNFNNNLGGTYRHTMVERKLSQLVMHYIEDDFAGCLPNRFARLAAFVLAYGHTPQAWKKFPNIVLSKIINMSQQFGIVDCFLISRGLQIAQEMRFRYYTPAIMNMQLATIDSILTTCAERHLNDEAPLSAIDLNTIVRTLAIRKSLKNSIVYHEALNKYKEIDCSNLNSRIIRDMTYNFNVSNYLVPNVLEAMFNYIKKNDANIMGETVEKVLTCAYNLGYTPKSLDVLDHAANILLRDFNNMSGLSLVQSCLALCFYKTIPDELINKVFCVKFIQRIEEEIQMCYSKATYPERVLNLVMQLNRTVCLDFPEANVPWFQQNYVEAQLSKKPIVQSSFSNDVRQLLAALFKKETYFRCNHTTPYGYQIDFVIHFDRNKKPITAPIETTMLDRITKVAILLLKFDSFCENDFTALRGPESLKIKHLEMMGYKVLHINEHDWNSKYMNVPGAKANYLKCLLQIAN